MVWDDEDGEAADGAGGGEFGELGVDVGAVGVLCGGLLFFLPAPCNNGVSLVTNIA